jgi:hypothetical protein
MAARIAAGVAILVLVALAAVGMPSVAARISRGGRRVVQRVLVGLLAVAALLAVASYVDFGVFRYGTYLNEWDFYHYYLGTKYAPELGYAGLYGATLAADEETGLRYKNPQGEIRDLASARLRRVEEVAAEAPLYKARFREARWRAFVADIAWFKTQLPEKRWSLLLADHGYNGTPAWSFAVGTLLTRRLSILVPWQRWTMLLLDPLLLLGTAVVVGRTFGVRVALLFVTFLGTHYLFSWGHLKGALLRTDFAMASVLAVCFVKQERYKLAGVLLGWAALSRVFPAFFLVGPAVLLAEQLLRRRELDRRLLGLLLASAATVVALVLASTAYFGGTAMWHEWSSKIALHYADGSDWDVGYRTIVEAKFPQGVPMRGWDFATLTGVWPTGMERLPAWIALALLVVPAVAFLRSLAHHEAVAFGFVFVFLFAAASYYYYLILCVPLLFFAGELDRPQNALGAAFLFLTGLAGYLLFSGSESLRGSWIPLRGWHQTFPTYFYLSCLVAVTVVQMIALAASRASAGQRAPSRAQPQCPSGL